MSRTSLSTCQRGACRQGKVCRSREEEEGRKRERHGRAKGKDRRRRRMQRKSQPEHFRDAGDLIVLRNAGKQRVPDEQLGSEAADRPHIDPTVVAKRRRGRTWGGGHENGEGKRRGRSDKREAKEHFGRAVVARLDIRVDCMLFIRGAPKIHKPNIRKTAGKEAAGVSTMRSKVEKVGSEIMKGG
jgi:hypothetical protein